MIPIIQMKTTNLHIWLNANQFVLYPILQQKNERKKLEALRVETPTKAQQSP